MVLDKDEQEIEKYKRLLEESYAEAKLKNNMFYAWAYLEDLIPEHRAQLLGNVQPHLHLNLSEDMDPVDRETVENALKPIPRQLPHLILVDYQDLGKPFMHLFPGSGCYDDPPQTLVENSTQIT
jgi:hypothetical protein